MVKRLFLATIVFFCSQGFPAGGGGVFAGEKVEDGLEYKVKAAFLVNFARLISWPAPAFTDEAEPLAICVVGADPFGTAFTGIGAKKIKGRKIVVRKFSDFSTVDRCHVMFVTKSAEPQFVGYLADHERAALVSVGESTGFASRGGTIEFVRRDDDKLSFKINHRAAKRCSLHVEASLLALAAEVY